MATISHSIAVPSASEKNPIVIVDASKSQSREKTQISGYTMPVQAAQCLLIDLSTHSVLLEKNAEEPMAPSSMTKIMTVYLVLKAIANKSLTWSEKIYVSENAARKPGSRMFIKPGEMVSVQDLVMGIVVTSGNDACTAIAEFLGGSEEGFAELMNAEAKKLGMNNSHFVNASGLPADHHTSTCKDLAIVAERTILDFPKEYGQFYKVMSFQYNGITQPNRNILLKDGFADGIKTGMTDAGKYGIVVSAKRPGKPERRLLLVLNGVENAALRLAEARRLLNWGFQRFDSLVIEKGKLIANVALWKGGSVGLVTSTAVAITLPKGSLQRAKIVARYYDQLARPIVKDKKLGMLIVDIPGQPTIQVPLVAEQDVLADGWWAWIKRYFSR